MCGWGKSPQFDCTVSTALFPLYFPSLTILLTLSSWNWIAAGRKELRSFYLKASLSSRNPRQPLLPFSACDWSCVSGEDHRTGQYNRWQWDKSIWVQRITFHTFSIHSGKINGGFEPSSQMKTRMWPCAAWPHKWLPEVTASHDLQKAQTAFTGWVYLAWMCSRIGCQERWRDWETK